MKQSYKSLVASFVTAGCALFSILTFSHQFSFQAREHGAHWSTREQPLQLLTVCDALKHRKLHNGKRVALMGRWSATDEGAWLESDCYSAIRTGDYLWPHSIWLEYDPSSPSAFEGEMPVNLATAKREIEKARKRKEPFDGKAKWVIVYGRFETHDELRTAVAGDGVTVYGIGFGHLNESPAQVVHKSKDILVISGR